MATRVFEPTPAITRRAWTVAGSLLVLGAVAIAAALLTPLDPGPGGMSVAGRPFEPASEAPADMRPLLSRLAGAQLIRPAQLRAAVLDRGLAKKLLQKLKLQGVIQAGEGYVAYIKVDKGGVETVRAGGQILELNVDKVEPGRVTLSLDGVVVELTQ